MFFLFLLFVSTFAFDSEVLQTKSALLRFSSRDCTLCEQLLADWNTVVAESTREDIYFETIYCEDNLKLCKKFDIEQYPTIKFYTGLEWQTFQERHQKQMLTQLVNYIKAPCRLSNQHTCSEVAKKWLQETDVQESHVKDLQKQLKLIHTNILQKTNQIKKIIDTRAEIKEKIALAKNIVDQ